MTATILMSAQASREDVSEHFPRTALESPSLSASVCWTRAVATVWGDSANNPTTGAENGRLPSCYALVAVSRKPLKLCEHDRSWRCESARAWCQAVPHGFYCGHFLESRIWSSALTAHILCTFWTCIPCSTKKWVENKKKDKTSSSESETD